MAELSFSNDQLRNRLLSALPAEEFALVEAHLERMRLEQRALLFETGAPIRYVYFPETAVVSMLSVMEDGSAIEVGTAGCEGMAGLPVFLAEGISTEQARVQVPGVASRLDADVFVELARAPGAFNRTLLRYTQAFLTQVAQTAVCNGAHLVEERCARWLLMTHDRVEGDEFPMTHEFLAFMLGVRRAGVTVALRALQEAGLVDYTRGRVAIADRAGLEEASCECYRVVQTQFERLLPQPVSAAR